MGTDDGLLPALIYHLAVADEWRQAVADGRDYHRSTLGKSLMEVGFIHCSFSNQVQATADLFYRGRTDVVLLAIDPARLQSSIHVESGGGEDLFPHVYGPVPVAAVVRCEVVPLLPDGRLDVARVLDPDATS
jgi:glutathione S-transferase